VYTSSLIASPKRPSIPRITRSQSIYHYCSRSLYSTHYTLLVTSVPSDTPFPTHQIHTPMQIKPDFQAKMHFYTNQLPMH